MTEAEDLNRVKPKYPNKKTRLTVGIPVSINSMYYNQRSRGMTTIAKKYFRSTKAQVLEYLDKLDFKMEESGVWQYLDIVVYMGDKRTRDSHNMLKLLLDSIEGVLFDNDYSILPRIQSVELDRDNPRLEMLLSNQTKAQRRKMVKDITE